MRRPADRDSYGLRGLDLISTFIEEAYVDAGSLTYADTKPLKVNDFIRRVLVPEVGVCLIARDRQLDRDEAIVELQDSRSYGMAISAPDADDAD